MLVAAANASINEFLAWVDSRTGNEQDKQYHLERAESSREAAKGFNEFMRKFAPNKELYDQMFKDGKVEVELILTMDAARVGVELASKSPKVISEGLKIAGCSKAASKLENIFGLSSDISSAGKTGAEIDEAANASKADDSIGTTEKSSESDADKIENNKLETEAEDTPTPPKSDEFEPNTGDVAIGKTENVTLKEPAETINSKINDEPPVVKDTTENDNYKKTEDDEINNNKDKDEQNDNNKDEDKRNNNNKHEELNTDTEGAGEAKSNIVNIFEKKIYLS